MREGGRAPRICGWGERVLCKRPSSPLGEPTSFLLLRTHLTTATATARVTVADVATVIVADETKHRAPSSFRQR